MNKAFCILFFLWLGSFTLACYAQMRDIRVYGSVYAQEENDSIYRPVESATVQLLHLPDSAYAAGSITNKEGGIPIVFLSNNNEYPEFAAEDFLFGYEYLL